MISLPDFDVVAVVDGLVPETIALCTITIIFYTNKQEQKI